MRLALRRAVALAGAVALVVPVLVLQVAGRAQLQPPPVDHLHDRLEQIKDRIQRIQAEAASVEEQIAAIDEQAAAVAEALAVSRTIAARTRARIAELEAAIARKERIYLTLERRAVELAVSMYKDGPGWQAELLLGARSLDELDSVMEYSGSVSEDLRSLAVKVKRARFELDADRAKLKEALADVVAAEAEQKKQAQHLAELRAAQSAKLHELRKRIESARREADAIEARSAQIAQLLASDPAPAPSGPSGFAWPISGTITSGYGPRWGRMHQGIDIDCTTGAPIRAARSGRVVSATYDSGYGYHVVIDHGGGYASLYAHNSTLSVVAGQSVGQGQQIASCGSTGQSTGDHLHFEIRVDGVPQDPLRYLP
jgi:murein DD-endopeptidase MepM/ murein hydrolase activator NlpD